MRNPSKEELLKVLDDKIDYLQSKFGRAGVTRWVLLTSGSALFLFMLSQLELTGNKLNLNLCWNLILTVIIFFEILLILNVLIKIPYIEEKKNRFSSNYDLLLVRGKVISTIFKCLLIITLLIFTPIYYQNNIVTGYFILLLLVGVLTFFPKSENILLTARKKITKNGNLFYFIFLSILIYFLYSSITSIFTINNFSTDIYLANFKLSIIFTAFLCVMLTYISCVFDDESEIILFDRIRMNLRLGNLNTCEALDKFDILMFGKKVDHLLEKEILALELKNDDFIKYLDSIQCIINNFDISNPEKMIKRIEEIDKFLSDIKSIDTEINTTLIKINKKVMFFLKINPYISDDVYRISQIILKRRSVIVSKISLIQDGFKNIQEKLKDKIN